jgi:CRP-like cAMP-binding protein
MSGEPSHWSVHFRKDRIIYDEGEPSLVMYRIERGCVRLQVNGAFGDRQIVAFLSEGDVFGAGPGRRNSSAEAVCAVDLACFSLQPTLLQAGGQPTLIAEMLDNANRQYGSLAHHLERIAHLKSTERVLAFVVGQAARQGRGGMQDHVILRMNRQDIADFLGLEPETVSRALKILETRGALTRHGPRTLHLHPRALNYGVRSLREPVATSPAA